MTLQEPVFASPRANRYNPAMALPQKIVVIGLAIVTAAMFTITGCVERTITITSDPEGALVYLNDREIGRTPVDVEFIHYGDYDVRLIKEGYEPQLTSGDANAPIWDLPGPDFFAELFPAKLRSDITWHYVLEPVRDDPAALVERAHEIRRQFEAEPAEDEQSDDPEPATAAFDDSAGN